MDLKLFNIKNFITWLQEDEGEKLVSDQIPEVIRNWFFEVTERCWSEAKNEEEKRLVQWKVEHTMRVVGYGAKIMEKESMGWNVPQGLAVCMLHDIGRFPQALMGSFVDTKTLNHAEKGRILFEKAELKLMSFNGNKGEIAEAIGEHNNPYYEGENIYTKLVRDADELAIIKELDWQIESHIKTIPISGKIRNILVNKFVNGEILNTRDAETLGDWMICIRSWERRFNFKASKEIYKEEQFGENIRDKYMGLFPEEKEGAELFVV